MEEGRLTTLFVVFSFLSPLVLLALLALVSSHEGSDSSFSVM